MTTEPHVVGGRFEILAPLGHGGSADVFRAHDRAHHRDVALKMLRDDTLVDRDRFESEAHLLGLLGHQSVVTLYDAGVDEGRPWLALELVDGRPLSRLMREGTVPARTLAALGEQVAAALAHAHARGVVHRDVKPSNILVTSAGDARLTDFGIARLHGEDQLTRSGHVVGTAAYLAPEQVRGDPATGAADVYALGLLLLEALSGRRCFGGPPMESALARLHHGPPLPDSLAPPWAALLARMTAVKPGDRLTASAAARSLRDLAGPDGLARDEAPDRE